MRSRNKAWLWLCAGVFAACGGRAGFEVGDFGDEAHDGGDAGEGGSSATGGIAGTSPGGGAFGGVTSGGSPFGGAPFGGTSFAGTGNVFTGGVAGAGNVPNAGFSGVAGAGAGGFGGQAGAAPMLGEPCTANGALSCHGAAQKLTLRCDGGFWRANGTCALGMNCDQRNGICTPIAPECVNRVPLQRFCKSDELVRCGVDNVTVDNVEDCAGRCVEDMMSATCAPPNCGDGRVQPPETCDDGNMSSTDDCTNGCARAACGDGFVWTSRETCDDFNANAHDGCSASCLREPRAVTAGYSHACALGVNGSVQCWGYNIYGELGIGDTSSRGDGAGEVGPNLPVVALGTGRSAKTVQARMTTSCAVLDNDTLKCWGYNGYGALGQGDMQNRGSAVGQLGDSLGPVNLGVGRTVKAVAVGGYHVCAILDDDSLKCWGHNVYGALGLGDVLARGDGSGEMGDALPRVNVGAGRSVRAVAAGTYSTCVILDDGRVKCWGYNTYGQLGLGDTNARGDAPNEMGDTLPAVNLGTARTARAIAMGTFQACAILDDSSLKCWGYNGIGQLGLGDANNRGDAPGEMGDALPAVNLGTGQYARAVSGGDGYTCALLNSFQVKCWGAGTTGQLGLGDTTTRGDNSGEMGDALPTLSFGASRRVSSFEVGTSHACALLDDLTIKCWGQNFQGSLGLGDSNHRGDTLGEMGDQLPPVPNGF